MYTIYERPRDFPSLYVARKWIVTAGRVDRGELIGTSPTLAGIRKFIPEGLYCIERSPDDDQYILDLGIMSFNKSEQKLGHTVDGIEIVPGMKVYCPVQSGGWDEYIVIEHVVESIAESRRKVLFKDPPPDGYNGARIDGVFAKKENAEEWAKNPPWVINFKFSDYYGELVLYALEVQLRRAKTELNLLRVANSRELNESEKAKLPDTLKDNSREDLIEQIDPWISLVDNYQSLVDDLKKKMRAASKHPCFLKEPENG